jgi:hypothetical protein
MNTEYLKIEFEEITVEHIQKVIEFAYTGGHTSHAPLGCRGIDYLLFGNPRRKEISLTLHSGDVKLLVTDNCGGFLFYGGFDTSLLPISFIAEQYFNIIQNVKYLLENHLLGKGVSEFDKQKMYESKSLYVSIMNKNYLY